MWEGKIWSGIVLTGAGISMGTSWGDGKVNFSHHFYLYITLKVPHLEITSVSIKESGGLQIV